MKRLKLAVEMGVLPWKEREAINKQILVPALQAMGPAYKGELSPPIFQNYFVPWTQFRDKLLSLIKSEVKKKLKAEVSSWGDSSVWEKVGAPTKAELHKKEMKYYQDSIADAEEDIEKFLHEDMQQKKRLYKMNLEEARGMVVNDGAMEALDYLTLDPTWIVKAYQGISFNKTMPETFGTFHKQLGLSETEAEDLGHTCGQYLTEFVDLTGNGLLQQALAKLLEAVKA